MSVISTTVVQDQHTQRDGRRDVVEQHTFANGEIAVVRYRAEAGADTAVIATARVAQLEQAAADREAEAIINA